MKLGVRHPRGRLHPLHDLRVDAGLTIDQLIDRAGIARSTWFAIASPGKRFPGFITLASIAQALGVQQREVERRIWYAYQNQ